MTKEKVINDINEIIKEINVLLDKEELVTFKIELQKTFISIKLAKEIGKELTEKLKGEENVKD